MEAADQGRAPRTAPLPSGSVLLRAHGQQRYRRPMARTPGGHLPRLDVVLLAGGRGARLGGICKAEMHLGGRRLLDRALDAVHAQLPRVATLGAIVVVGDVEVPHGVRRTREDPPFGGPVAGLAAGVDALPGSTDGGPADWCLVLACDVAEPALGLNLLGQAVHAAAQSAAAPLAGGDGFWLVDQQARPQWLFASYRREALLRVLTGPLRDRSVRTTLGSLHCIGIPVDAAAAADIDTWADVRRWERRHQTAAPDDC